MLIVVGSTRMYTNVVGPGYAVQLEEQHDCAKTITAIVSESRWMPVSQAPLSVKTSIFELVVTLKGC